MYVHIYIYFYFILFNLAILISSTSLSKRSLIIIYSVVSFNRYVNLFPFVQFNYSSLFLLLSLSLLFLSPPLDSLFSNLRHFFFVVYVTSFTKSTSENGISRGDARLPATGSAQETTNTCAAIARYPSFSLHRSAFCPLPPDTRCSSKIYTLLLGAACLRLKVFDKKKKFEDYSFVSRSKPSFSNPNVI